LDEVNFVRLVTPPATRRTVRVRLTVTEAALLGGAWQTVAAGGWGHHWPTFGPGPDVRSAAARAGSVRLDHWDLLVLLDAVDDALETTTDGRPRAMLRRSREKVIVALRDS
jgi:hypothetical protein